MIASSTRTAVSSVSDGGRGIRHIRVRAFRSGLSLALRIFALPEPVKEFRVPGREVVGANRSFLETADYIIDHMADTEFFLGGEDIKGPCLCENLDGAGSVWMSRILPCRETQQS